MRRPIRFVVGDRDHAGNDSRRLTPQASLAASRETALNDGSLDAFATDKGILYELTESVPGARMLPGRWGEEHLSLGFPGTTVPAGPS